MLCTGRRNARRDFHIVTCCIAIQMQACTIWTHSDVRSQLATTPECSFKIGDQHSEKTLQNCPWRLICNATHGIDAEHGVIRHPGVSDCSDGAHPLIHSHSARTEMFFADVVWTFQGRVLSLSELYFSLTPPNQLLQSGISCPPAKGYWPVLSGVQWLNNGYNSLNLQNI